MAVTHTECGKRNFFAEIFLRKYLSSTTSCKTSQATIESSVSQEVVDIIKRCTALRPSMLKIDPVNETIYETIISSYETKVRPNSKMNQSAQCYPQTKRTSKRHWSIGTSIKIERLLCRTDSSFGISH